MDVEIWYSRVTSITQKKTAAVLYHMRNQRNLSTKEFEDNLTKYIDDSEGVATLTLDDLNPVLTMVDDDGEQQETLLHNEVCLLSG